MAVEVSRTVLQGFSNQTEVERGMSEIDRELARERQWYAGAKRFAHVGDLAVAVMTGELVKVEADENIQPIGRFRNPALNHIYPPYLTPNARDAMSELGKAWRVAVREIGVPDVVKLAATSFVRTDEYQDELVREGKFAVPDSTHPTGNAFDIDLGGYSIQLGAGREVLVSLREPKKQKPIAEALQSGLQSGVYEPERLGPKYFIADIPNALLEVAKTFHEAELLNVVPEMIDTPNRVLHMAVAPRT